MAVVSVTALEIDQGDDEVLDIAVKEPDGTPADISGCKLWFWVKLAASNPDSTALISKSTDPGEGITITNPTGGIAEVTIDRVDTASLPVTQTGRKLAWSLQVLDGASKVSTLAKGSILINRDLIAESV